MTTGFRAAETHLEGYKSEFIAENPKDSEIAANLRHVSAAPVAEAVDADPTRILLPQVPKPGALVGSRLKALLQQNSCTQLGCTCRSGFSREPTGPSAGSRLKALLQ